MCIRDRPYIPVTRKQYLELCINHFTKFFDNPVAEWEKRSAEMGIKTDPSEKEKWQKQKKDVVKHYQDELANTTTAGLLESPAIVMGFLNPLINYPIFIPETEGGHMLVTENPKY